MWVKRDILFNKGQDEVSRHLLWSAFNWIAYGEASCSDAMGEKGEVVSVNFACWNSYEALVPVVQTMLQFQLRRVGHITIRFVGRR